MYGRTKFIITVVNRKSMENEMYEWGMDETKKEFSIQSVRVSREG
jgi:hypothetical protein